MILAVGFLYILFVEEVPLIPSFLRASIMNWYWILSNAISMSNDMLLLSG